MPAIPEISRTEPELPGLTDEYLKGSFEQREAKLGAALHDLSIQSEDVRPHMLPLVKRHLEICRNLGVVAGVEIPTPIMTEAEVALGTSV